MSNFKLDKLADARCKLPNGLYPPYLLSGNCPACGALVWLDFSTDYLAAKYVDEIFEVQLAHECEAKAIGSTERVDVVRLKVSVTMSIVED